MSQSVPVSGGSCQKLSLASQSAVPYSARTLNYEDLSEYLSQILLSPLSSHKLNLTSSYYKKKIAVLSDVVYPVLSARGFMGNLLLLAATQYFI